MKHFALILLAGGLLGIAPRHQASAQCAETLSINTTLASSQSETGSIFLVGDLSSVTVNLNYTGSNSSYPGDMMVYIYAPDGSCVVLGGWNVDPVGGCTDLGTGTGGLWPPDWSSTASGNYTATIDVSAGALSGSGDWTVAVQNAYATGDTVTYDVEFTFDGPCAGECPDPLACNYVPEDQQTNPLLDVCEYAEDLFGEGYDCDGVCLNDEDGDGICDEDDDCFGSYDECGNCGGTDTSGCTDEMSCNYDPNASCDDGGCLYLDACGDCGGNGVIGCTNNTACNFDPNATCDSGGCLTLDECGVCGGSDYLGCTDEMACNYDEGAGCDDGSCLYDDAIGVCGGSCAADEDGDGLCDACTDPDGYWIDIETVAEHTEGELIGMTTYRLYAVLDNPSDYLFAVTGGGLAPLEINSTSGTWYNHPDLASWNPSGLDTSMLAMDPNLAFDSFMTIGSENSDGGPFPFGIWTVGDPRPEFQPGGGANVGMGNGTMQLFFPGLVDVDTHPAFAGDDLRVLVMQITTEGDVYGQFNVTVYPGGQDNNPINSFVEFDSGSLCFDLDPCVGEYDECGVCEGLGAVYECGCFDVPNDNCDCEGNQLDALGVCDGSCVEDADADGVCDVDEVLGCTVVLACNYDPEATEDDGTCFLPPPFHLCDGSCVNDSDSDGVCDELSEFDYSLVVESSPSTTDVGTIYRFYVQMEDASDRMSAVFGTDSMNLKILAPSGVFNSLYNLGWNAAGINPAFLPVFPELVDDTYATIGLTGPASSSGMANAADPALVEDPVQPISPFFVEQNQTTLLSSTLIGASWYVLNTAANGLPDENGRVLVMQVTTAGPLYGTLNYQVFPLGQQGVERRLSADFLGEGAFAAVAESVLGCTDEGACNFDPNATTDDGSCTQFDECGLCGGPGIPAGECDCEGALIDDCGVCGGLGAVYDCGCADIPEGECDCDGNVVDALGVCGGECLEDANENGICDAVEEFEFPLMVVASPAVSFNATVYRFYVQMSGSQQRMSAVFGTNEFPMYLQAPGGVFNWPGNLSWSASGLNPAFLQAFPELVDDSYATVGLSGPAAFSDIANAEDPSKVEDANQMFTPFFTNDGSQSVTMDSFVGGSWYVLNSAGNGFPDEDGRVLIMQLTTYGLVAGKINYQLFPVPGYDRQESVVFSGEGTFFPYEDPTFGCTDLLACNYDPLASDDDGTCLQFDECGVCDGPGIACGDCDCEGNQLDAIGVCGGDCEYDTNNNGICDFDELQGSQFCGWGTVWNADSGACVLLVPPFFGAFGDYNTLNPCYYDLDLSGSVGAGDLINFLSTYGLETGCSWTDE